MKPIEWEREVKARSDGLPYMIELTLWMIDEDGYFVEKGIAPKPIQTRVFLALEWKRFSPSPPPSPTRGEGDYVPSPLRGEGRVGVI